eukprot:scaffold3183_cov381-Prasinococcus_capsulatus_cf.AAC.18
MAVTPTPAPTPTLACAAGTLAMAGGPTACAAGGACGGAANRWTAHCGTSPGLPFPAWTTAHLQGRARRGCQLSTPRVGAGAIAGSRRGVCGRRVPLVGQNVRHLPQRLALHHRELLGRLRGEAMHAYVRVRWPACALRGRSRVQRRAAASRVMASRGRKHLQASGLPAGLLCVLWSLHLHAHGGSDTRPRARCTTVTQA